MQHITEIQITHHNPLPFTIWQLQVSCFISGADTHTDPSDPVSMAWWSDRDEICYVAKRGELGVDSL